MVQTVKQKAKRYSLTERMDALAILRDNGYNFTKTSRVTKISVPSLRHWHTKHGKELEEVSQVTEALVQSSEKLQNRKRDFIAEVYDTKLLIIQRVRDLIPSSRSIKILTDALDILHDMENDETNPQASNLLAGENRDFVLNFVSNQIAIVTPDGKITRQNKITNINNNDHGEN